MACSFFKNFSMNEHNIFLDKKFIDATLMNLHVGDHNIFNVLTINKFKYKVISKSIYDILLEHRNNKMSLSIAKSLIDDSIISDGSHIVRFSKGVAINLFGLSKSVDTQIEDDFNFSILCDFKLSLKMMNKKSFIFKENKTTFILLKRLNTYILLAKEY